MVIRAFIALSLLIAGASFPDCTPAPKYRAGRVGGHVGTGGGTETHKPALSVTILPPVRRWSCSRITSRFGPRGRTGRMHEGIDIDTKGGEEVFAAASGTVSFAGRRSGYGNMVIIDHAGDVSTAYAHLVYACVRRGEGVDAGERIGRAGKRGRATGTHLHFEIRLSGRPVDPEPYLCLDSTPRSP